MKKPEVKNNIENYYLDLKILAQTETHIMLIDREGYTVNIFKINQEKFWVRPGFIGTDLMVLERRDMNSDLFLSVSLAAFTGLSNIDDE